MRERTFDQLNYPALVSTTWTYKLQRSVSLYRIQNLLFRWHTWSRAMYDQQWLSIKLIILTLYVAELCPLPPLANSYKMLGCIQYACVVTFSLLGLLWQVSILPFVILMAPRLVQINELELAIRSERQSCRISQIISFSWRLFLIYLERDRMTVLMLSSILSRWTIQHTYTCCRFARPPTCSATQFFFKKKRNF